MDPAEILVYEEDCQCPGCRRFHETSGGNSVARGETAPVAPEMLYPGSDSAARKAMPVFSGVLRYFPAALSLVAVLSRKGNDKHNPGQPLHHNRAKSGDEGDCILRHQMEVGTIDPDTNLDHAVGVAWRALAQLQKLAEEKYGWPLAPGALQKVNPERDGR